MTERLYYDSPYSRQFDATVVRVESRPEERASLQAVWLDRTAFYPTTGGQPFDTGVLGSARVVDVVEDTDGDVMHLVNGTLMRGDHVHGTIDWRRRFDHMQQHTGQHVLSAAFVRLFEAKSVSFHLGSEISTIDLNREMTPKQITAAEEEANQVVWENRPVTIRYATADEAAAMLLRKEPKRTGTLRLIDVADFDLSACGGTHVGQTGAIGVIAATAWERFKGGQRLEFVCGGRALARFRTLREAAAASVRMLSVLAPDIPVAIERMQADVKEQKRALANLQTQLAKYQARELSDAAEPHPRANLILRRIDGDANVLKTLASAVTAEPGFLVVLVTQSSPALVVAARSVDVAVSCHDLVTSLTKQFGGGGGGKPDLAQGGGLSGTTEDIFRAVRSVLE